MSFYCQPISFSITVGASVTESPSVNDRDFSLPLVPGGALDPRPTFSFGSPALRTEVLKVVDDIESVYVIPFLAFFLLALFWVRP